MSISASDWPSLAALLEARSAIAPHLHRTPLWRSRSLGERLGVELFVKAELLQRTGSYKPRGMLWRVMRMSDQERARGAITFSAGNAAQGLAYAAGILGTQATVVMPAAANPTKVEATKAYGAEVILHGTSADAFDLCRKLAAERGLTFVSSYDDRELMLGHASLGLEILEDVPDADAILLGIGGGGMAGGIAMAAQALSHKVALHGIEPTGAAAMTESLAQGRAVRLDKVETIADGLSAPSAGEQCFVLVRERFASVVTVPDAAIVEAMLLLMTRCKLFAEPAGAAALAGLLTGAVTLPAGAKVVCVVSGGNLDPARLKSLLP